MHLIAPGDPMLKRVHISGIAHPFWLRDGTSDEDVVHEVFIRNEYCLQLPRSPRIIVDAGANIGCSAIFFTHEYPRARILAVEPEASNYSILRENIRPYPNIRAIHAALWAADEVLAVVDAGLGHWGFQVQLPNAATHKVVGTVQGLSLPRLMSRHRIRFIDLLKMDIEGSEHLLFASPLPWLALVGSFVMEIHLTLDAGRNNTDAIEGALAGYHIEKHTEEGWCPKIFAIQSSLNKVPLRKAQPRVRARRFQSGHL
jgi:FkbM family methyltransferase